MEGVQKLESDVKIMMITLHFSLYHPALFMQVDGNYSSTFSTTKWLQLAQIVPLRLSCNNSDGLN